MWYKPGGGLSDEQIAESFVKIFTEALLNRSAHAVQREPRPRLVRP
jgi:hypothetical protein